MRLYFFEMISSFSPIPFLRHNVKNTPPLSKHCKRRKAPYCPPANNNQPQYTSRRTAIRCFFPQKMARVVSFALFALLFNLLVILSVIPCNYLLLSSLLWYTYGPIFRETLDRFGAGLGKMCLSPCRRRKSFYEKKVHYGSLWNTVIRFAGLSGDLPSPTGG